MTDTMYSDIVKTLTLGVLVITVILLIAIYLDVSTIEGYLDPARHCNGEILWNVEWDVFECKEIE